jgi:Gram-negative bacterial TonB protein C-terminal
MNRERKKGRILGGALLAMALSLGVANLQAQESRKVLSNPVPAYPEVARRMHLTGVVKVQIVVGPDGHIQGNKRHRRSSAAGERRRGDAEELEVCAVQR